MINVIVLLVAAVGQSTHAEDVQAAIANVRTLPAESRFQARYVSLGHLDSRPSRVESREPTFSGGACPAITDGSTYFRMPGSSA